MVCSKIIQIMLFEDEISQNHPTAINSNEAQ